MSEAIKLEKTLQKLTEDGAETAKILSAAERLLACKPNHVMALRCKVVCCMNNEKFGAAIAVLDQIERANPVLANNSLPLRFQRAYCLYRMQCYLEAKLLLQCTEATKHIPSQNLLAQVFYNLEDYAAAAAVYESLLQSGGYRDEQERMELLTNYTAALSASEPAKALAVVRETDEKFSDLAYNAAAALIEAKDYDGALKTLQQAEILSAAEHPTSSFRSIRDALAWSDAQCLEILGDAHVKTPERKLFNDVASIWTQMALVHYATGDEKTAEKILKVILAAKPSSVVTSALASINLTAIRRHGDFFDSARRLKAAQNARVATRLTSKQMLVVRYNAALLHLNAGNFLSCRKQVDQLVKDYPDSDLARSLKVALGARESKKKRQANERTLLAELTESNSTQSNSQANIQLLASQVFLEQGDLSYALEALESPALVDIANSPAGVLTRASWLLQMGRLSEALQRLEGAIARLEQQPAIAKAILVWAVHNLTSGNVPGGYELGVQLLKKSRRSATLEKDHEVTALLALCLSHVDVDAARACVESLGEKAAATSAPMSATTVNELEKKQPTQAFMEELGYRRAIVTDGEGKDGKPVRRYRPRPMRRKPKQLEGRPDPERWIPMPMRSYIKDLPERRKKELRRLRAQLQEHKRRAAGKRKAMEREAAAAATQ